MTISNNYEYRLTMKYWLLIMVFIFSSFCAFAQDQEPDYTIIKFKSRVKEYKKEKPSFEGLNITKETISDIVNILGKPFYTTEERDEITEKAWLSLTDPQKFDFVHKDYAVRSYPNWDKPNFQGKIVLEPNQYLKDWTNADTELDYFKIALHRILTYQGLMGYGEDAKETKKYLSKMKYAKGLHFRSVYPKDWTNSYLQSLKPQLAKKKLVVLITNNSNYEFMICKASVKSELLELFGRMRWKFVDPQ